MGNTLFDNLIHQDDVIYNALLDGGEDEKICMKYAVLGAIHDSAKPKESRVFYKDDPAFMNHLMSIVNSALRIRPAKVKQTLLEWFELVKSDLDEREHQHLIKVRA